MAVATNFHLRVSLISRLNNTCQVINGGFSLQYHASQKQREKKEKELGQIHKSIILWSLEIYFSDSEY